MENPKSRVDTLHFIPEEKPGMTPYLCVANSHTARATQSHRTLPAFRKSQQLLTLRRIHRIDQGILKREMRATTCHDEQQRLLHGTTRRKRRTESYCKAVATTRNMERATANWSCNGRQGSTARGNSDRIVERRARIEMLHLRHLKSVPVYCQRARRRRKRQQREFKVRL